MDDIWWFLLCVLALLIGFALGWGAGRFGFTFNRVSMSNQRWAEVDGELTGLRSDNASLRASVTRLEDELETARMFARSREAGAEDAETAQQLAACEERSTELEETIAALESQLADRIPAEEAPEAPPVDPDDLKKISGVGPYLEKLLHSNGVYTFAQIAALDEAGIDELQGKLEEFPGRIRRDEWVRQAAELHEETHGAG